MIVVWALLCALPLALSHDLGGPLGLVALAPMMALSLRRERAFTFGFLCGFFEVSLTMWGASSYTVMIPVTLALQGGLARGALAWAVSLRSGPVLPLSVLVVGQGLRTTSVLTLPLSCGHDLAAWWWLGLPAAWGGGALLTAICGGVSYALVEPAFRRRGAGLLLVLIVITGAHELLRPVQGEPIPLKASVIQGGLPNWVYRQASVDPDAAQLINARYLEVAARERPGRLLILPETAVRETWGLGPMTRAYRALHGRGDGLVAGVNYHLDGALRNSAMVWRSDRPEPVFQTKRAVVPVVEREFEALRSADAELPFGGRVQLCIESVYPRYSDPSAGWLLVLSNDAGVGRSAPRRAFERESRLRALETGRSLVRAGQDGLTYLVSPRGQIVNQLEPYSPGVLRLESLPAPRWALRGWLGDWVFWGACCLILGWSLARRRRREQLA